MLLWTIIAQEVVEPPYDSIDELCGLALRMESLTQALHVAVVASAVTLLAQKLHEDCKRLVIQIRLAIAFREEPGHKGLNFCDVR